MFRRLSTLAATAFVATALTAATAAAQATCGNTGAAGVNCSPAGTTITTTVQRIIFLSVNPEDATLTAPDNTHFVSSGTAAITNANLHVLTARSNASHNITLTAGSWTQPGGGDKVVGDVEFDVNAGGYNAMTGSAQTVITGAAATGGATYNISYRTTWRIAGSPPGAYTLPLTFTITAP
jgi:hypothetical protein